MIPGNVVTRSTTRDPYQFYDKTVYNPLIYTVRAGLDIRDASSGLDMADWVLWFDIELKTFNLDKDNKLALELGIPSYGRLVEGVAFAFDEDMRLYWGYTFLDNTSEFTERRLEFNWYNPLQNATVKMLLNNVHSMHVLLDDTRTGTGETNDVILFYVRNSDRVVCARYQRDLFAIEYPLFLLRTGETFVRVGVTVDNQIQFEIGKLQKPFTWVKLLTQAGVPVYDHNRNPIWVVENTMSEAFNTRPTLADLTYQRTMNGAEYFIINDKGEEKQLALNVLTAYIKTSVNFTNYYTKSQSDGFYAKKVDVYTRSEVHNLFEVKGVSYPKSISDGRYAYKDTSYTKVDTDRKYATKESVYTRAQTDSMFALKTSILDLASADSRYLKKVDYVAPTFNINDYLTKAFAAVTYARQDSVYTTGYIEANFVKINTLSNYYTKAELDAKLDVKDKNIVPVRDNLFYNGLFEHKNVAGWNPKLVYTDILSPRSPYGNGRFTGKCERLILDQTIPLLLGKDYYFNMEYRYINKNTPGIGVKFAFLCFDSDNLPITGLHYGFDTFSVTRLAAPLRIGDTTMKLESVNGWLSLDSTEKGRGNILFFNYKNKAGYSFTDTKTPYTRNIALGEYVKFKSSETSAPDQFIDPVNKVIQLSKPWDYKNPNTADGSFPIGTRLARSRPYYGPDEFELRCRSAVGKQFNSPDTGVISYNHKFTVKYNATGRYDAKRFPPGTVYVKPVLYPNYNYMADKTEYGVELSSATDANSYDVVAFTQLFLRLDM